MSDPNSADPIVPGDRVILRSDGEEYTVDQVQDDPHQIWLRHQMFGDGPDEFVRVKNSDVVKVSRFAQQRPSS